MSEGCRSGRCELDANPSSGNGYVWQCIKCGRTVPINSETYRLFNPGEGKCNCPRCAWPMIVTYTGKRERGESGK